MSIRCLLLLASIYAAAILQAADHTALQRYLSADVEGVAYVDLTKLDLPAVVEWLAELKLLDELDQADAASAAKSYQLVLEGLKNAGVKQIYFLLRTSDVAHGGPTWVIPLADATGADAVQTLLMFGSPEQENYLQTAAPTWIPSQWRVDKKNTLIGCTTAEQLEAQLQVEPIQIADLDAAWSALGNDSAGGVVFGTADSRRVVREMLPALPVPFDALDGSQLADGLRWGGITVSLPPKLAFDLTIETAKPETAARLAEACTGGWHMLGALESVNQSLDFAQLLSLTEALTPQVAGTRLTISPTAITANAQRLTKLLTPPIQAARQAAWRNTRMNQFKNIALAFHKYADSKKQFPQDSRDSNGKPLLSWRVHILPYLEAGSLYSQFHLDEPWDSEHNRTLIEKMPAVYADPDSALRRINAAGKTTFVVPAGAGTLYDGPQPKVFKDIIDGTSNTIMLVEVVPEKAVTWTQPADWEVDFSDPWKGIKRTDRDWFTAAYWDAHGKIIPQTFSAEGLRGNLTPAGGEPVELP